jgi:N-methylhydantoinase B
MSGVVCSNDGDTHNSPCEQLEAKYPVLFERFCLRADSGGPGRYRGGLGTEQVVRALAPITVDVQAERMHCPPWGIHGGMAGKGNHVTTRIDGREDMDRANAKLRNQRLKAGDALILRTGGGGGFGDPHERPAEAVANDVRQGYVSAEVARTAYGVTLQADGSVDLAATGKARKK